MATKKKTKRTQTKRSTAKPRASKGLPTAKSLAAALGVGLTPRLKPDVIVRLRKPLPGYVGLLDDVAKQLCSDSATLNIKDVTPEALLAVQEEQKQLAGCEVVAETVYRSIYEQRLVADDRAMAMLLKVARRVEALTEDDANLPARWKFLRDFLAEFRPGRPSKPVAPALPVIAERNPN